MRLFLLLFVHFLCINLWASTGQDMVKAAQQLLESLTPEQRTKMTFEVKDTSREIWHYLPVASFARFGVPLNQLDADQDALVYHLLEVSLSTEGYDKARQIMDLEKILKVMENNSPNRDPEQYHIAIYGTPSLKDIWSWSFSGHHISLHFTMIDGQIADTPTFLGSNPAEVRQGAHQGLRVLKDEEDMGLKLIQSMSEAQQKEAIFTEEAPYEIFTAAQSKVDPLNPEGIVFVDLTDAQKNNLKMLVQEYISILPEELAMARNKEIEEGGWDKIYFAWAGVTDRSAGHYYRVQGPRFLIEFDNTQNNANHIHTVWRDFDGDFGRDLLREHYKSAH